MNLGGKRGVGRRRKLNQFPPICKREIPNSKGLCPAINTGNRRRKRRISLHQLLKKRIRPAISFASDLPYQKGIPGGRGMAG